jgi:hypothetical protein
MELGNLAKTAKSKLNKVNIFIGANSRKNLTFFVAEAVVNNRKIGAGLHIKKMLS